MLAETAVQALHATAVAIGGRALVIRGASRAGKSRLALALIARSRATRPISLIGDDRIQLHRTEVGLVARPHPRIAGFIERRGLGLVAMSWIAEAPVGGVVDLRHSGAPRPPRNDELAIFPDLVIDDAEDEARADRVLAWWAGLSATWAPHPAAKAVAAGRVGAKD